MFNGFAAIWAFVAHHYRRFQGLAFWIFTAVAQFTMFIQVCIGSWLLAQERGEITDLHALYGFSGLLAIGVAYGYHSQLGVRIYLLYGAAALFLMGLGIRAMVMD